MPTSRPLLSDLRLAVRDNLDEVATAYWTDARLNRCLTRAADTVLMEARKVRQGWFTTPLLSNTPGSTTIYGETYTYASAAIIAEVGGVTLPPDLLELQAVECLTSDYTDVSFTLVTSPSDPGVQMSRKRSNNPQRSETPHHFYMYPQGVPQATSASITWLISPLSNVALDLQYLYVSSSCIFTTAGVAIRAFTADTDQLVMPHPLYMAVEEVATWRAQMQDHDPMGGAWDAAARASVARFIGSTARQSQDPEFVQSAFEW